METESINWKDGHAAYDDIQNPIVRIRFNERVDSEGNKVIFIEELQPPGESNFKQMPEYYQKHWMDLGLKRIVRWAAENGFKKIGWTTGRQQQDRYDLRKEVKALLVTETGGVKSFAFIDKTGSSRPMSDATEENLDQYIGGKCSNFVGLSSG